MKFFGQIPLSVTADPDKAPLSVICFEWLTTHQAEVWSYFRGFIRTLKTDLPITFINTNKYKKARRAMTADQ
jgi:hypothetical protein